jgi:hypothetical protein
MIDMKGQPHVIKKKEKLETLEKDELVPDYLSKFSL